MYDRRRSADYGRRGGWTEGDRRKPVDYGRRGGRMVPWERTGPGGRDRTLGGRTSVISHSIHAFPGLERSEVVGDCMSGRVRVGESQIKYWLEGLSAVGERLGSGREAVCFPNRERKLLGVEADNEDPVEALQGGVANRDQALGVPEGVSWMWMSRSATTARKAGMTKERKGSASGRWGVGIH